jgi:hypothetical protein
MPNPIDLSGRSFGHPFESKSALKEHKSKERIRHKNRWVVAPRKAQRMLAKVGHEVSLNTLARWDNDPEREREKPTGCPWLGGRPITTFRLPGGYNRTIPYYLEADILAIIKAKKAGQDGAPNHPGVLEYPSVTYIYDACDELEVSEKTLRREAARHEPLVKLETKPGVSPDGRGLPRTYVPTWFVEETKKKRSPKLSDEEITVNETAILLGCSNSNVHVLIDESKLNLADPNARLAASYSQRRRSKNGKLPVVSRGVRHGFTLLRSEVLKAKAAGVWPPRSPDLNHNQWQSKKQIAAAQGLRPGKRRNEFFARMNEACQQDPTIAAVVWLPNARGRLHPRTRWDTAKLYHLLDRTTNGKAPSPVPTNGLDATATPQKKSRRGPDKKPETINIEDRCLKLIDTGIASKVVARTIRSEFGRDNFNAAKARAYASVARNRPKTAKG